MENFAVPADHKLNITEDKKSQVLWPLRRIRKKSMEHEVGTYNSHNW